MTFHGNSPLFISRVLSLQVFSNPACLAEITDEQDAAVELLLRNIVILTKESIPGNK